VESRVVRLEEVVQDVGATRRKDVGSDSAVAAVGVAGSACSSLLSWAVFERWGWRCRGRKEGLAKRRRCWRFGSSCRVGSFLRALCCDCC